MSAARLHGNIVQWDLSVGNSSCFFLQFAVNLPCVAEYSLDQKHYRAKVLVVGETDCYVQFVDYGNTALIDKRLLYPLPVPFLERPTGAFQCKLIGTPCLFLLNAAVMRAK